MDSNRLVARIIAAVLYAVILGALGSHFASKSTSRDEVLTSERYAQVVSLIREQQLDARKIGNAFRPDIGFVEAFFGAILNLCIVCVPYGLLTALVRFFSPKNSSPAQVASDV